MFSILSGFHHILNHLHNSVHKICNHRCEPNPLNRLINSWNQINEISDNYKLGIYQSLEFMHFKDPNLEH